MKRTLGAQRCQCELGTKFDSIYAAQRCTGAPRLWELRLPPVRQTESHTQSGVSVALQLDMNFPLPYSTLDYLNRGPSSRGVWWWRDGAFTKCDLPVEENTSKRRRKISPGWPWSGPRVLQARHCSQDPELRMEPWPRGWCCATLPICLHEPRQLKKTEVQI